MLVFLDEFGATTTMQRTHGRAAPGERVVTKVPHGHWKMISTIAAMSVNGIVASCSFDGATDTELFVTFTREALVQVLEAGADAGDGHPAGPQVAADRPTRRSNRRAGAAAAAVLAGLQPDRDGDLQGKDGVEEAGAAKHRRAVRR